MVKRRRWRQSKDGKRNPFRVVRAATGEEKLAVLTKLVKVMRTEERITDFSARHGDPTLTIESEGR